MTAKKWLTIDITMEFVNDLEVGLFSGILDAVDDCDQSDADKAASKTATVKLLNRYGVAFPVAHSVVYAWMLRAGATHEVAGKCFYTDRHDQEDVIKYRNDIYHPEMTALEERSHLWLLLNEREYDSIRVMQPTLQPRERIGDKVFT